MSRLIASIVLLASLPISVDARDIPFLRCFELASLQHDVPLPLLLAVAEVESGFNPDARSSAGAHGIMQVRWPVTAKHLGVHRVAELYNPCLNIDLGAAYLSELLARYDGNLELALAAYNYGPTRLRSSEDIPATVQGYVLRVMARQVVDESPAPAGVVTLNRFDRRSLAEGFARVIRKLVPNEAVLVQMGTEPGYIVLLDRGLVSRQALIRLNRLYPYKEGLR